MKKSKVLLLLFVLVLPNSLWGKSLTDLLGAWRLYVELPDGRSINQQNISYAVESIVEYTKNEKAKLGEEFTQGDSIEAYRAGHNNLSDILGQKCTFKPGNVLHLKQFTDGKPEEKDIKFTFHSNSKEIDITNNEGVHINGVFDLKKENNTLHLYCNSDLFLGLTILGWKVYFVKIKS